MEIEKTIIRKEVIKGTLGKPRFEMSNEGDGYHGRILFPVLERELMKGSIEVKITADEWNAFWSNFNNGKYLIEQLKEKHDLTNLEIPADIEDWFVNQAE